MRPAATLMQLVLAVSSVTPVVSAWPSWLPEREALVVRADSKDSTPTATPAGTASSPSATETGTKQGGKTTGNLNTAKPTSSPTSGGDDKDSATPTHTEFPQDAPLGGVSMIEPAVTALGTALYRISDYVTFSWNYTSLLGEPSAIDVIASCSQARASWTLTANMSYATSVNYVWDTKDQADDPKQPLLTSEYSLIIKDSDVEFGDNPEPGYLGTSPALRFGLYAGKPYENRSTWTCPGCHSSAASAVMGGQAVKLATAMGAAALGLTWLGIN